MELREFAEQVLFATTLEEKLRRPGTLTDERPGPAMDAPPQPGRPSELRFKPPGSGNRDFPGVHRLEQERERGRLLHFFANHELLATELMALVLLRFPDAPPAFRRGVLQTLQEEQDHTRLYLRRMEQCGIRFGELPVSGYFWRSVSPMARPMDFVAGLSLTFEQANLDFCRHFAQGFNQVGDALTAELLEGIYRDEIAHVAHGLKWFRRWKDPAQSDWEAFCQTLQFPLSPRRAKGAGFNVEGRRAAGLDTEFIARLNAFSQSKGRTPTVHVFNPFTEGYMAKGVSFSPVKSQVQLARDLAVLPMYLAREDDVVLLPRRPSDTVLADLADAGFPVPEFVEVGIDRASESAAIQRLSSRKLGALRPWAWGPDSVERLGALFDSVTGDARPAEQCFNEGIAQLYSKAWSANFLRDLLVAWEQASPNVAGIRDWICPSSVVGREVSSWASAQEAIAHFRSAHPCRLVVKEALGLAGANALRLWEPTVLPAQEAWMCSALERGGRLVVEPWLDRVGEFSVHWEMRPDGLHLRGFAGLLSDHRGQYQGNWAEPRFATRPPHHAVSALAGRIAAMIPAAVIWLGTLLEPRLRDLGFLGPLGIDSFLYRDAQGSIRWKPVVEINPRCTMGRLTLELMRAVAPGSHARFRLVNRSQLRGLGVPGFPEFARTFCTTRTREREGEPVRRIREGCFCLTDSEQAEVCVAVFEVRRQPFNSPTAWETRHDGGMA